MAKAKFDSTRCKGCGLCVNACPKKIVGFLPSLNAKGYRPAGVKEEDEAKCTGCAACATMCPDLAITVE